MSSPPSKGRVARLWPALGRRPRGVHLWRRERPRVWAHRGASAHATENTIAAFELAVAHGADGIELDVLQCASGEVVVFHDDDLQRLAGRPAKIAELPWSELSKVELIGGHRIPLLEDALAAAGALEVNVELKTLRPGRPASLPAAAAVAIRRAGAAERVLVSSFDPVLLYQMHQAAPELPLAFLYGRKFPRQLRAWTVGMVAGASALHPEEVLCTPASVADWHRRGFAVNTWTVDDPTRLRELDAAGVDGVFANDPRAALAAFAARP